MLLLSSLPMLNPAQDRTRKRHLPPWMGFPPQLMELRESGMVMPREAHLSCHPRFCQADSQHSHHWPGGICRHVQCFTSSYNTNTGPYNMGKLGRFFFFLTKLLQTVGRQIPSFARDPIQVNKFCLQNKLLKSTLPSAFHWENCQIPITPGQTPLTTPSLNVLNLE